jgi:alpha-N-arabinofuranosidase
MNSSGAAFVHNIFGGIMNVINYDSRLTPYHKPHSTFVVALHDNPDGDIQFVNNLFISGGNASKYSKALLPVVFEGNVYTKGSVMARDNNDQKRYGELNNNAREQMKKYNEQSATETNALVANDFDASATLFQKNNNMYLEIALDKSWLSQKRKLVTTETLTKAIIPDLPFENTDGSPLRIDTDYLGHKRNAENPSPGPIEISVSGKQMIKLFVTNQYLK